MTSLRNALLCTTLTFIFFISTTIHASPGPEDFRLPETSYDEMFLTLNLLGNNSKLPTSGNDTTKTDALIAQNFSYTSFYQNDYKTFNWSIYQSTTFSYRSESITNNEGKNSFFSSRLSGNFSLDRYLSKKGLLYLHTALTPSLTYSYAKSETSNPTYNNSSDSYYFNNRSSFGFGYGKLYDVTSLFRAKKIITLLKKRFLLKENQISKKIVLQLASILHKKNEYKTLYKQVDSANTSELVWKKHFYNDIKKCLEQIPALRGKINFFTIASIDEYYTEYFPQRFHGIKLGTYIDYNALYQDNNSSTDSSHSFSLRVQGNFAYSLSDTFYLEGEAIVGTTGFYGYNTQFGQVSLTLGAILGRQTFFGLSISGSINYSGSSHKIVNTAKASLRHKLIPSMFINTSISYTGNDSSGPWSITPTYRELGCEVGLEWKLF